MRKFLIAAAVAVAASFSAGASANAADVKIVIGHDRAPARHHVAPKPIRGYVVRHRQVRHRDHCSFKKVVSYRHGHKRVKTVKVCR
ncbi:hypothetical protein [Jiella pacifica]|uniref:Uncharacterized protein n=1 Tax=Jiella pacifica TaxID=2696469 RepID=A0A6N9TEK7_9HYPH|nr:hypothetical protein [Jiella pacifica]NDW07288.1 hypothetical protein [Jiella pacifica]